MCAGTYILDKFKRFRSKNTKGVLFGGEQIFVCPTEVKYCQVQLENSELFFGCIATLEDLWGIEVYNFTFFGHFMNSLRVQKKSK